MEIDFINIEQGDAILIITANPRKVILVDGGKSFKNLDYGENEVIPYFRRKGIFKIDYIISTHGDNDHKGGLNTIVLKLYCIRY